jgi:hypothetical protein
MFILYISASLVAFGAVFMLVFLKALTRESRADRKLPSHGLNKKSSTFPLREPYRPHDRAA